jgi:hypothetical protein
MMGTVPSTQGFSFEQWIQIANIALSAAIATGKIPPAVAGFIQTADDALTAAVGAVQQAKTAVDPSQLKPIDPIA